MAAQEHLAKAQLSQRRMEEEGERLEGELAKKQRYLREVFSLSLSLSLSLYLSLDCSERSVRSSGKLVGWKVEVVGGGGDVGDLLIYSITLSLSWRFTNI